VKVAPLHPWDVTPGEAMALQRELASRVVRRGSPPERWVRLVAGADCAFDRPNGRAVGAVAVLTWPSLEVVEEVTVEAPVTFPYVPGLLSFRETPVLLAAFERLRSAPDLLMVDGHGYAHPRRFGYACHLGLLLDIPTIGVAKSRLIGEQGTVAGPRGSRADLTHEGEVIGSLLRTREGVWPVYVSVGHRISLQAAEAWALRCATRYRVPEPTRLADRLAGAAKRRMLEATLEAVIEQRAGEERRWEWEQDRDEVVFRHELEPMPAHYGCSVEIMNAADGELLDVMLLDSRPYERGQRTVVRVIDVLRRTDGDDKLLALPVDRAWPAAQAIERARKEIWAWYVAHEKPVTRWGGEEDALRVIKECAGAREW
jgi:deoxyribonuclease V